MSMGIYHAYRLSKKINLGEFMKEVQAKGTENVAAELSKMRDIIALQIDQKTPEFITKHAEIVKGWEGKLSSDQATRVLCHSIAMKKMNERYAESNSTGLRSAFDFDVSATFRYLDGYWYMQIFSDALMRGTLNFAEHSPGVKEYHYQNSTDRADGISIRDWKQREKVWNKLYNTELNRKTFLSLVIMDIKEYQHWDAHESYSFMDKIINESRTDA